MSKTNKDKKSFQGFREFYADDDKPKKKPSSIRESSKDKMRIKERIKNINVKQLQDEDFDEDDYCNI